MKKLFFAALLSGSMLAMGCQPTEEGTEPAAETTTETTETETTETETTPAEGEEAAPAEGEEAAPADTGATEEAPAE